MHVVSIAVAPSKQNPAHEAVTPSQLAADLDAAWDHFDPDILVGTEIQRRRYRPIWRRVARAHNARSYGLGQDTPIASRLRVAWARVRTLHRGLARATPARKNVTVKLRGMPVLVIAKHATATGPRLPFLPARLRLWATDAAKTRRRIARARRHGRTVIVAGDPNVTEPPNYGPGELIAARAGVIWILVYPAPGHDVQIRRRPSIPASERHADHAAIGAHITIASSRQKEHR